ncbi:non-ribosomal peptide synthetase [Pseudonocardia sichuanensis]|uniref:Phenyloxazoline synthase MbtB n=1 Tax=Pseudonocardia kunmingensis TaxID=630975 RepID=A0A543D9W2_9PSEU|nr:non-ribosomal peptide synthetase [Pseudonocardia kunmingensis]TQM06119.1 amino acid adenylation domain-containing protein [Pseudonocardia kunmingensis]
MSRALDEVARCAAAVLGAAQAELPLDRPLQELGLESFAAVRLHRRIAERTGVEVPLEAFVGASVESLALEVESRRNGIPADGPAPGGPTPDHSVLDEAPLTPIQAAYWVGREPDLPLGGVATFYYYEFDRAPDRQREHDPIAEVARLEAAWNRLVDHHPMLRAVVGDDGWQRVLAPGRRYRIGVTDLRAAAPDEVATTLESLRRERSHQVRDSREWPLYDRHAAVLPEGTLRLFVGFDILVLDMVSWILLMRQWGELVADHDAPLPEPKAVFLDLVRRRVEAPARERHERDRAYWRERLRNLPPAPDLPQLRRTQDVRRPRFRRHAGRLGAADWRELRERAASRGLSPTGVLLAAYALTLSRWGAGTEFCLNATLFDRSDEVGEDAGVVGDFSTTLLVALPAVDLVGWKGFAAFAAAVNGRFWADLEHRSFSGVEVQRELARREAAGSAAGGADGASVVRYPYVFTSGVGLGQADGAATAWLGEEVYGVSQTPQVLLDHIVWDEGGELRFAWDAVEGVFPDGLIDGMLDAHLRLLRRLAGDESAWDRVDLGWDPTFRLPEPPPPALPGGPLLDQPQRRVAVEHPDGPAVLGPDGRITHDDLVARADALGAALTAAGVRPGARVVVALPKSPAQIVAAYGVLAAGAAFVPVEPDWPLPRIASVCRRAEIELAVVAENRPVDLPDHVVRLPVDAHGRPAHGPGSRQEPDDRRPGPDGLAYVIFTSGSSGEPKGVAIEHRAARTTIDDIDDRFGVGPDDRVLALSALSFDLSIYDLFGVLGVGGALVLPAVERQRDPGHWCELIAAHEVTVWNTAPAVLEMLVEYAEADAEAASRLGSLRLVLLSGDWIPVTLPGRLRALAPRARVISLGGATEASIWSIHHPIGEVEPDWASIPYGRPLRGQFFHVLDAAGRPCPVGETGELFIAGHGLAREYVGDPRQTAERFATHPALGVRLYRTGDLGRWQPTGTIEFLGRADRQVKIRGHRIELGEIESVVNRLPGVRQCVAAAVPGADGRPRLVGYVVGHAFPGNADEPRVPAPADLSAAVAAQLPAYMVPSRWVTLDELPLSANGKVDPSQLPNPFRPATGAGPVPVPAPEPGGGSELVEVHRDGPAATAVGPAHEAADGSWLVRAAADADRRGLDLAIRIRPGRLSAADTLTAAGRWVRELEATVAAAGLEVAGRLVAGPVEDGLVELHLSGGPGETPDAAANTAVPAGRRAGADRVVVPHELERRVAEVFADVLGSEVPATTPFGDLGATSLSMVVAHRRFRELAPDLTLLDLFAQPTVRALTARIAALTPAQPGPVVVPEPARAPAPAPATTAPPDGNDRVHVVPDLAHAAVRGRRRAHHLRRALGRPQGTPDDRA